MMADNELELWLIRHGETQWNRDGRIQGQSDPPLNDLGVRQAEALAKRIGGEPFDAVVSSDLRRALSTAQIVMPARDIALELRLREIDFGTLEGKVWQELEGDEGVILEAWRQDSFKNRAPEGESYGDLARRVQHWLKSLPRSGRVIAFAHGGTIRSALYAFTGQPQESTWGFSIQNTSITKLLIRGDHATLLTVNDAAHLEGPGLV